MTKLKDAAQALIDLAHDEHSMTFTFDEGNDGYVRIDWMGCLKIEVPPNHFEAVLSAMRRLENLGLEVF